MEAKCFKKDINKLEKSKVALLPHIDS